MSTFRRVRIGVLLLVLAGVGVWAAGVVRKRERRRDWRRPLDAAVVVVTRGAVPGQLVTALVRRLDALEQLLEAEMRRHRGGDERPFLLQAFGPVPADAAPPEPEGNDLAARVRHYVALRRWRKPIDRQAGDPGRKDVVVYLVVSAAGGRQPRTAEGMAAAGGELGLVETTLDAASVDLALIAVGHELLHLVGASDKYDADGHATPAGLVDAARGGSQQHAEIMVGEIPLGPGRGRLATRLDEVRVGPVTAREIGWVR